MRDPSENSKQQRLPSIRAVAISAPDAVTGAKNKTSLNSSDPASLFNACRVAAHQARTRQGAWADSNWAVGNRSELRKKFLHIHSMDEIEVFRKLLVSEQPNIVLIGAMTLCLPGAMACAQIVRNALGASVLIVLGGWHASETIYIEKGKVRSPENVLHHTGSPSRLVREKKISDVFDIVISGDGEHIIAELGSIVAKCIGSNSNGQISAQIDTDVPGDWIASFPREHRDLVGQNPYMQLDSLPGLASLFGVTASFDVFGGRKTAHVFSGIGRGCVYDCGFCSERRTMFSGALEFAGAPKRLHDRLSEAYEVIQQDSPGLGASAFVEDSVFLSGNPKLISDFARLLEQKPIKILFGAQLTVDKAIHLEELVRRLSLAGLVYVFVGLETIDPMKIGGFSKDIQRHKESWISRFFELLRICDRSKISCGCALLLGLGETHKSRISLLETLLAAKKNHGSLSKLSVNWAVQHPLQGNDAGADYNYTDWGTPKGEHLSYFQRFGEASMKYPIPGTNVPSLGELGDIVALMNAFEDS